MNSGAGPQTVLLAAAYLAGAVPFGFLIARARGVDIRTVGSGNVGATNVFRSVGKGWGILTFVCDALKGFLPAFFFPALARAWTGIEPPAVFAMLCGMAAIVGHNWPVFLRFKGGKGIATSAGALLGAAPPAVGVGLAGWLVVFLLTRYVSVASVAAAALVPAAGWWLYGRQGCALPALLTLLGALAIWRHRGNLQRLRAGTEHRFDFRKRPPAERKAGP